MSSFIQASHLKNKQKKNCLTTYEYIESRKLAQCKMFSYSTKGFANIFAFLERSFVECHRMSTAKQDRTRVLLLLSVTYTTYIYNSDIKHVKMISMSLLLTLLMCSFSRIKSQSYTGQPYRICCSKRF